MLVDVAQLQAGLCHVSPLSSSLLHRILAWHISRLGLHEDRVQEILQRVLSTEYPNDPNAQPLSPVSEANPAGMRFCVPFPFACPATRLCIV